MNQDKKILDQTGVYYITVGGAVAWPLYSPGGQLFSFLFTLNGARLTQVRSPGLAKLAQPAVQVRPPAAGFLAIVSAGRSSSPGGSEAGWQENPEPDCHDPGLLLKSDYIG